MAAAPLTSDIAKLSALLASSMLVMRPPETSVSATLGMPAGVPGAAPCTLGTPATIITSGGSGRFDECGGELPSAAANTVTSVDWLTVGMGGGGANDERSVSELRRGRGAFDLTVASCGPPMER